jgi:hypothetical protein
MAGNGGGEKYLGVDLGLASFRATMWDVTLRAGGRCGCAGGDRPEGGGLMAEVTG